MSSSENRQKLIEQILANMDMNRYSTATSNMESLMEHIGIELATSTNTESTMITIMSAIEPIILHKNFNIATLPIDPIPYVQFKAAFRMIDRLTRGAFGVFMTRDA